MDQARFEGLLADFQARCSSENSIFDLSAVAGQADQPIVLLVHGIGGNFRHWADPVGMNVNDTWLFDTTAHPPHNTNGIGMSPGYAPGSVSSWTDFLHQNNVTYINFSQAKPGDLLEFAVHEVVSILTYLENIVFKAYEDDVASSGGQVPPLVIVCHSRGGLVTRGALKQLGSAGVPHLRKVITLFTPHLGSYMPKFANDYNNNLHEQVTFHDLGHNLPGPIHMLVANTIGHAMENLSNLVRFTLMRTFGTMALSPGFEELIPNSGMLTGLAQDEQPLPGVQYFSFGGSDPTVVNMYLCVAGQAIHLLGTASPTLMGMFAHLPGLHDSYGGLAELGAGDSAVALSSSRWPGSYSAPHQEFKLNHMQALVDRNLQQAVLQVIHS